jgi:predicted nucleotidyltransferase
MSQNVIIRPETWLEQVLSAPTNIKILRLLWTDPGKYWTEREAAHAISLPQSSARNAFRKLEELGLLDMRQAGRAHLVRPRPGLAINERIEQVFQLERSTLEELVERIRTAAGPEVTCYLFGSTARKEAAPGSDLDLLIVAPDRTRADHAADKVRKAIRTYAAIPTNVIALSLAESRARRYRALLRNVLQDGRLLRGKALTLPKR